MPHRARMSEGLNPIVTADDLMEVVRRTEHYVIGFTDYRAAFGSSGAWHSQKGKYVRERLADGLETYHDWPEDFQITDPGP